MYQQLDSSYPAAAPPRRACMYSDYLQEFDVRQLTACACQFSIGTTDVTCGLHLLLLINSSRVKAPV